MPEVLRPKNIRTKVFRRRFLDAEAYEPPIETDSPEVVLNMPRGESLGVVAHFGPVWQMLGRSGYAGTETVVNGIIRRNDAQIKKGESAIEAQVVSGNPSNVRLESTLHHTQIYYPADTEFVNVDNPRSKNDPPDRKKPVTLLEILRTDAEKAIRLEEKFTEFSYGSVLTYFGDKIKIIHDHTGKRRIGIERATQKGKKVIFTIHGPVSEPDSIDIKDLQDLAFCKNQQNAYFVGISKDQMSNDPTLPWGAVVHNGIDLSKFPFNPDKPKGHEKMGKDADNKPNKYVVWIGRKAYTKGLETAILAAVKAGVKIAVCGEIEDTPRSREHHEKYVVPLLEKYKDYIVDFGDVGFEEKAELMAGAVAVVNPVRWKEPFGLVNIEGPAVGTPTIGPNYGAAKEIIVDGVNGFKVDTSDPSLLDLTEEGIDVEAEKYADMIRKLLRGEGPDARTCREDTALRFSDTVMAAKYEAYDRYIIGGGDRSTIMTFTQKRLSNGLVQVTPILLDRKDFFDLAA